MKPIEASDVGVMMAFAQKVIVVPGYGMAVAQAQHKVWEMCQLLIERGVQVKFAIHPVAGRMPGHMNVLLAEAGVPYDLISDLEEINAEFETADVALIIGANDVVNPVARTDKSQPHLRHADPERRQGEERHRHQARPGRGILRHRERACSSSTTRACCTATARRPRPSSSTRSRRRVNDGWTIQRLLCCGLSLIRWLRTFQPLPMKVDARRARARRRRRAVRHRAHGRARVTGSRGDAHSVWLIAPMGASAVLVFGVPASPMAQPWAVVGGNTVAAAVGIACVHFVPDIHLAAALAVSLAIGAMFLLGCLHPPGGASALLMVLTHTHDPSAVLFPVLFNAVALTAAGVLYNTLTGPRLSTRAGARTVRRAAPASRFSQADLDFALTRFNQVLNVSRDDLEQLLNFAEAAAYDRNLGELTLRGHHVARTDRRSTYGTPLEEAWTIMRLRRDQGAARDRSRRGA